jgi:hypothetical protein
MVACAGVDDTVNYARFLLAIAGGMLMGDVFAAFPFPAAFYRT